MLDKIKKTLQDILSLLSTNQNPYRIVEIDLKRQEVLFQVKNKAVFLRCGLAEAISDISIIEKLSPCESCWLGGYFGRTLRGSHKKDAELKKAKNMSFFLTNNSGQYRIVFENRSGEIGYIDQETKQEFIEHPITVANHEHIISGFSSRQACYIGILAGISIEKTIAVDKKKDQSQLKTLLKKPPKLRLICK